MIELVLIVPVKDVVNAQEDTEIRLRLIAQIEICRKVAGAVWIKFSFAVNPIVPSHYTTSEQSGAPLALTIGQPEIYHLMGDTGSIRRFPI